MSEISCHQVVMHRTGGPEVLRYESATVAAPGKGELRIVQSAIGLNFATHFPIVPGSQGAGHIEAIGQGVTGFQIGQAVTYLSPGAYASVRLVPAERTLALPAGLSLEVAAATLLRGMTADYLLHRLYPVKPDDIVLINAAAGGMGQLLSAWAKHLGARVIGVVGSAAKRAIALNHGCHEVIDLSGENMVERVQALTRGEGVHVVYDAVGRDLFLPSLDCLRAQGMAINYGTASGDVEHFDLQRLHAKSLIVSRPTLRTYIAERRDFERSAARFAHAVEHGFVRAEVSRRYALSDIQTAHAELEGRQTTGASVIIP
jgi:NADPH:quinone reductase